MAEAFDTRELAAALDGDAGAELTITDLPNDVLVSIFEAVGDLRYVSHTAPCVCKEWAELYRSQDARPLHETLEFSFSFLVFVSVFCTQCVERETAGSD